MSSFDLLFSLVTMWVYKGGLYRLSTGSLLRFLASAGGFSHRATALLFRHYGCISSKGILSEEECRALAYRYAMHPCAQCITQVDLSQIRHPFLMLAQLRS